MIYYDQTVLIASGYCIHPDTGDKVLGDFKSYSARVINNFTEVRSYNGEKTISAIKIYLSNKAKLTVKSVIQVGEEEYPIINLEEKKHLNGDISHYVVYL